MKGLPLSWKNPCDKVERDDLGGCISCGCLSLDRCKLYNPGDCYAEAHRHGNLLTEGLEE